MISDVKIKNAGKEKPIIEIRGLGKKYDIRHSRGNYIALRDVLMNIIKSPFAFAKDKVKTAVGLATKEEFWAIRDINLNIERGEVIGVIGANGAGKSTLLKILTGITPPTEGEAILRGRVSSLLEVGTGFHPELTGRENIFLNGAILGMRKREIAEKFDEIVAFAGIEKFLDTPVKHYSSGMYVRLAFSVAAHMEPDILLVDEVLAVGDAEFQRKCLGKMEEVTKKQGRTILFVSHNMGAIQSLCSKSIWIKNGKMEMIGETSNIISKYIDDQIISTQDKEYIENKNKKVQIRKVSIFDKDDKITSLIKIFEPWSVRVEYDINEKISGIHTAIIFTDIHNTNVFVSGESDNNPSVLKDKTIGKYTSMFHFPATSMSLNKGAYFIRVNIGVPAMRSIDMIANIPIIITDVDSKHPSLDSGNRKGIILLDNVWNSN